MNVALVDGNLDHPSIAEKLRLDIRLGWNDATRTGLPVEEVAVQSIEDGLTVLPLAAPDSSRNARPSSEATRKMLSRLRSCFDLVILDTAHMNIIGGWLPGTDSPCQIDAALVIDDLRQDDAEAMQACLRRLQKLGIEHVGLVENFAA
jgi:Mrp family chromosome partitioning ATPase